MPAGPGWPIVRSTVPSGRTTSVFLPVAVTVQPVITTLFDPFNERPPDPEFVAVQPAVEKRVRAIVARPLKQRVNEQLNTPLSLVWEMSAPMPNGLFKPP